MKIKKSDLVEKLAERMEDFSEDASNKQKAKVSRETVNLFFQSIKDALIYGDRVEIRGFGSFSAKHYDEYIGKNPKTGEKVNVKPKRRPVFRPGKGLKKLVDNGGINSRRLQFYSLKIRE